MKVFPFGEVDEEKLQICIDYGLIEEVGNTDIWRLTPKCRKSYDYKSFFEWIHGKRKKPIRLSRLELINELVRL